MITQRQGHQLLAPACEALFKHQRASIHLGHGLGGGEGLKHERRLLVRCSYPPGHTPATHLLRTPSQTESSSASLILIGV